MTTCYSCEGDGFASNSGESCEACGGSGHLTAVSPALAHIRRVLREVEDAPLTGPRREQIAVRGLKDLRALMPASQVICKACGADTEKAAK